MNKTVIRTGLWSSALCLASFIIWIISFTGIAVTSPVFYWTNLNDYIEYVSGYSQFFQYLAKSFMIVFSMAYVVLILVYYEFSSIQKQIFAKISVAFTIMFALLSGSHYFIQISAIRFAITENQFSGLEHFIQANPISVILSVNMFGWTILSGLSSLFMFLALQPDILIKTIRTGLLINTISCFSGTTGYLFQIDIITFIFMNLGVGAAFLMITISSIRFFYKKSQSN